ncbi:unnamed protein product [Cuscuta europaea]|uniref:Reverse transcriptase domain-containing protein n=1 Tax=Cuscuta europaea TaxID=41803 RepID=A0A9P0Z949_CUSEU|nr:unnamed protein product [Cuscuta europaea]
MRAKQKEAFWRQKANVKWIWDGDANTNFFHEKAKEKVRRQQITAIKGTDGEWVYDRKDIATEAVSFFTKIYEEEATCSQDKVLKHIPCLLDEGDNEMLSNLPGEEKIKEAIWSLSKESAPGPDGFGGTFYRGCWDIIKKDVVLAVQEFFLGLPIPRSVGSANMVLIPKKGVLLHLGILGLFVFTPSLVRLILAL